MNIVSNCKLCEEHSLHIVGEESNRVMQCINCGYASSDRFVGDPKDSQVYKDLTEDMQSWVKETDNRFWIPSIMTLPFGMLYPFNDSGKMKWAFAEMVDVPEEEQKNYPIENGDGFYKQRYDTDNQKVYDIFLDAMVEMNSRAKVDGPSKIQSL